MAAAPPTLTSTQRVLRFALEVAALAALATAGFDTAGWPLAIALPLVAAVASGTFGVTGDPRSGSSPVKVPGIARLLIELTIFLAAAAGLAATRQWIPLGIFATGLIVHHALTIPRLRWLLAS